MTVTLRAPADPSTLWTLTDIASRFQFSESSARRRAADAGFPVPALVVGGHRRFWKREEVEAYACSQEGGQ